MSKIKDWKQITTFGTEHYASHWVVQDVKDQRLKANHNLEERIAALTMSGSRCQRSKIESKSQQTCESWNQRWKWFKMSKIKDWKQITTERHRVYKRLSVVQDVKDQRLKANHNISQYSIPISISGSRCQRSKIESKSQQKMATTTIRYKWFKMSKIKDWKQITTLDLILRVCERVVQDVKDQRLKANHNQERTALGWLESGSRCQRSKIESKSQLIWVQPQALHEWFKMSKIKDWKQITTSQETFSKYS